MQGNWLLTYEDHTLDQDTADVAKAELDDLKILLTLKSRRFYLYGVFFKKPHNTAM